MDSYVERLRQELEATITGAEPTRMEVGPAGKWSPAQVLEHLYLTYRGTNAGLAKCLEKGVPLGRTCTFKDRVRTFAVINLSYFPSGRKAPERAEPRGMPAKDVSNAIFSEIERMEFGFKECERKFGARAKILDHPVLGPLNVEQWRKFHLAHGRHHARQIRERLGNS
jgi:hypothetical protein